MTIEQIKSHIKRNQKVYITGGVCLLAGITLAIMRERVCHAVLQTGADGPDMATMHSRF